MMNDGVLVLGNAFLHKLASNWVRGFLDLVAAVIYLFWRVSGP